MNYNLLNRIGIWSLVVVNKLVAMLNKNILIDLSDDIIN